MNDDDLKAEMLNPNRRVESGIARAVERSRFAQAQGGEPDAAWSMGEKLLNALVFDRPEQLEALNYSEAEASDRLRYDFDATESEFPTILSRIRDEL